MGAGVVGKLVVPECVVVLPVYGVVLLVDEVVLPVVPVAVVTAVVGGGVVGQPQLSLSFPQEKQKLFSQPPEYSFFANAINS